MGNPDEEIEDDDTEIENEEDGEESEDGDNAAEEGAEAPKVTKSIVPAKYAGKYKAGQRDELGTFIDEVCVGKEGFEFPAFFSLCRINGIPEEKVAHYETQYAAKAPGIQGRARMTLRNMLATFARKNGKLKNLAGEEVPVAVAKPPLTGAAAKAQETAAAGVAAE